MKKWIVSIMGGALVGSMIAAGLIGFITFMKSKTASWEQEGLTLSFIQRLAIQLAHVIQATWYQLIPGVIFLSILMALGLMYLTGRRRKQ